MSGDVPRNITPKTKVDVAIMQAAGILCPLCGKYLQSGDPRVLEHMVPRALFLKTIRGNPDQKENLRWVHKRCADLKTRGCEGTSKKHSVANGDTHRIRKADRIASGGKKVRRPLQSSGKPMAAHVDGWGKKYRAKVEVRRDQD